MGILIGDKNEWNQGTAQEIIHYICKYLFKEHKIVNIFLGVDKKNISATKAYNKSGFVFHKKNKHLMVRNYFLSKSNWNCQN